MFEGLQYGLLELGGPDYNLLYLFTVNYSHIKVNGG